jgi:hypothetical protein
MNLRLAVRKGVAMHLRYIMEDAMKVAIKAGGAETKAKKIEA